MVNERKEVLNDGFGINDLIGSKEFCPVCDTSSPIAATTIPIHAREKSFNASFYWRGGSNLVECINNAYNKSTDIKIVENKSIVITL